MSAATLSDSSLFETWNDLSEDTQDELVHISRWKVRRNKWSRGARRELTEAEAIGTDGKITPAGFKLQDFGSARMLPYENPGLVLTPVQEGPDSYRLNISGKVGRTEVKGRTAMLSLGLYVYPDRDLPRDLSVTVNKAAGGKLGFATQRKVEDAVRLKFEELRDQVREEERVARRDRNPASTGDLVRQLRF